MNFIKPSRGKNLEGEDLRARLSKKGKQFRCIRLRLDLMFRAQLFTGWPGGGSNLHRTAEKSSYTDPRVIDRGVFRLSRL